MKIRLPRPRRVNGRTLTLGLIAAGTSAALLTISPAGAATDVATGAISGGGSISPGLISASLTFQSFTFQAAVTSSTRPTWLAPGSTRVR